MKAIIISSFAIMILFSASCAKKDSDAVADAQACLDSATQATALSCTEKVAGIDSPGANLIRCAANFIADGFASSNRIATAMTNINSGTGATNSMAMMDALRFQSQDPDANANYQMAAATLSYCQNSSSKGLTMIASMASIANSTLALVGACGGNFDASCAASAASNPAAQAAVGAAAIAAYETNCTNGNTSNGAFCEQFASVAASGDNAAVGAALLTCYSAPTTPGCQGF